MGGCLVAKLLLLALVAAAVAADTQLPTQRAQELERLQRALDGVSSPGSSEPPSPCPFFAEPEEPAQIEDQQQQDGGERASPAELSTNDAVSAPVTVGKATTPEATAAAASAAATAAATAAAGGLDEEEEAFNLQSVLKEGRRQRRQREHQHAKEQQQQQQQQRPAVTLPPADVALDEAAERVRQRQVKREQEAASRAARHAADEVQHVSSAGPRDASRRPAKKQQQVYVGLPVGVGWHVPLVGVEGRGGYKQSPEGEEETKKRSPPDGQRRPLTIKERERLKRKKGQSSHATWKPETWMQLRQQYD
ncbi:hypothetical protein ACSSS7_001139 [Eimeria intestinalis]